MQVHIGKIGRYLGCLAVWHRPFGILTSSLRAGKGKQTNHFYCEPLAVW